MKQKQRVPKGKRYWYIIFDSNTGEFWVNSRIDYDYSYDEARFCNGNYFHSEEEAESMARKLRAVFKGEAIALVRKWLKEHFKTEYYSDGASYCDTPFATQEDMLDDFDFDMNNFGREREMTEQELTWLDIARIADIMGHTSKLTKGGEVRTPEEYYSEVLQKFNA